MKKSYFYFVLCLLVAFVAIGCAQKPESADSQQAISNAQKLQDVKAQADYLIKEANAFLNSQQFDLPPKKWTQRRDGFSMITSSKTGGVQWKGKMAKNEDLTEISKYPQ